MRQGSAFVLSAPSGAGKSTLCAKLLSEFPNLRYSVSCTTREPRHGEEHGKDYFFLSRQEFERMAAAGELAEWAEVHGNFYGTPLKPVRQALEAGQDILFDVDTQGAARIKTTLPGAKFVFILPPSLKELEKRLKTRALDCPESIARRLALAPKEIAEARWFDWVVVNDQLEKAYERLRAAYIASTLSPAKWQMLIDALITEKA